MDLFDAGGGCKPYSSFAALMFVSVDQAARSQVAIGRTPKNGFRMANNSKIEWTDATWNPVRGCTKISPGCSHCYAETFAERFRGVPGHPYELGFDLRLATQP